MDETDIESSAKFLIERRGAAEAKEWAAQQALAAPDAQACATWLRILQAVIDLSPSPDAGAPLN